MFKLNQRVSFLINGQPAFGDVESITRSFDDGTVTFGVVIGDGSIYYRSEDEINDASDVREPMRRFNRKTYNAVRKGRA